MLCYPTDNRVPPPWPACQMAVAKPREAASSPESRKGPRVTILVGTRYEGSFFGALTQRAKSGEA